MKNLPIISMLAVSLAAGGCATKKYVSKSIDPVNAKIEEQRKALEQTNQSLAKTQQTLEADETKLNATNERATGADARAGDALSRADAAGNKATDAATKADQAAQRADAVGRDVGSLRSEISNLDDYKKVSSATVNFKFNSDRLDPDGTAQLDQLSQGGKYKRYFIAVEGFADNTGNEAYNAALSRRRANAVVAYLVGQHDIPVYRIQMVGLGQIKPVDDGKTAAARAKNRRVEVTVFSADAGPVAKN